MNHPACLAIRAALLDPDSRPPDWRSRPAVAGHLRACDACREFVDAFAEGERAWLAEPDEGLADAVIARTAGVEAVVRDLPALGNLDPGPGFAERVLAATARRPHAPGWRTKLAASWWGMVRRPRFAWEAAYVATVCWVLFFGNPVGALERSASSLRTVAHERLGAPARDLASGLESWSARLAPDAGAAPGPRKPGRPADPPAVRAWQSVSSHFDALAQAVRNALAAAADRITEWIARLGGQPGQTTAEPNPPPVRSGQ